MKTMVMALTALVLTGCSALATVSAGNCGWAQNPAGDNVWTCSATTDKQVKE